MHIFIVIIELSFVILKVWVHDSFKLFFVLFGFGLETLVKKHYSLV